MTDVLTSQVTVGTAAQLLVPSTPQGQQVIIRNRGAASIFIGGAGVTASGAGGGMEVQANETFAYGPLELPPDTTLYGIAATGTQRTDVVRIVGD